MKTYNIKLVWADPDELTPEEMARMEHAQTILDREVGRIVYEMVQKATAEKAKKHIAD